MSDKTPPSLPGCDELNPTALQVEQARNKILASINFSGDIEKLAIREALNRVLADTIKSTIDVPSYTNSAMDGYAISGADIPTTDTKKLTVIGTVMAGKPLDIQVSEGECIRIMTGGKMPAGTDTVIMQEHVQRDNTENSICISPGHHLGQNVRQAGEDLSKNDVVFQPGKRLTPADIGMLASMGIAEVSVSKRIKVIFFSTGDELCDVGQRLKDGQIYDSNRYTLYGMLRRLDIDFIDMGVIPDQRECVIDAFQRATMEADVLITTGGVSVGEADFVKETLEKLGHVGFWKIAMKPGRPLAFGRIGDCQFFGLPGNPVSAMVTFYQFVQPALLHMMGIKDVIPQYLYLRSETTLKKRAGRLEFQRGIISNANGETVVRSTGAQGSGILSSMGEANCFIELPAETEKVEAGEWVKVQPFAGMI
ncbi:MAG: molybdopterin molybdotransferase MoeA [Gammaproteobacteria bacterium]|nr:molybdopterin molybdotransferase MoeA [Gammaproteobacteria bacterium]